jgi:Cu(I)/Ag(I) efflux system membrane protein CusA/SilA
MIQSTVRFSIERPAVVAGIAAALCFLGVAAALQLPKDALPEIGETQVIVYSEWDRDPSLLENQVTYPLVTRLMSVPKIKAVRGVSDFGRSFVYAVFEDGTDLYWARNAVQQYLAEVTSELPAGVKTKIGPDATGLGWVFQYVVTDPSGRHDIAELRSVQDWYIRFHLRAVQGVAEVATVGGFERQYQVALDPIRLRAAGVSIQQVSEAVRGGNKETGGRVLEAAGAEYMIRGHGYAQTADDIAGIAIPGTKLRVRDLGTVALGPEIRRGVADWNGSGEAVSGIVVMRERANALETIRQVKRKLEEIKPGLPQGVEVRAVYDRSVLVERAVSGLETTLVEVVLTVVLVIVLFLGFSPAALIPIVTIPAALLLVVAAFRPLGVTLNLMSLGGLAIGAGALVDASIIVIEQAQKRLEEWQQIGRGSRRQAIVGAVMEVTRPAFFALMVTSVAFLPVFALNGRDGQLFHPLAWAKSLTMAAGALLAVTLDPALRLWLAPLDRKRSVKPERSHSLSGFLIRCYEPVVRFCLRHKRAVLAVAALALVSTPPAALHIGSELMPGIEEGTLLYMPTTAPGISIGEATRLLRMTDRIIKSFPEVEAVLGKAGSASTATDPAPLSMLETIVVLKPREQWPAVSRWYSGWSPEWVVAMLRRIWPDRMSEAELAARMDAALHLPGVSNSWTMPVRGRIDMLSTGLRSAIGLKVSGPDSAGIEQLGARVASVLRGVPETRSAFAERNNSGRYIDIDWDRGELARQGISVEDAQQSVERSIGGEVVTTVVDGRARYSVNVRYARDFRSDLDALRSVVVASADGSKQFPLSQAASVHFVDGPSMIRDENGLLTSYLYVDVRGSDTRSFIGNAQQQLAQSVAVPAGYNISWSGEYEQSERTRRRLLWVVPLTILLVCGLIFWNTRSLVQTGIVLLAVPFSCIGAIWMLYLAGYQLSLPVWIGLIALVGVDAQTGVFMLLYLDLAWSSAASEGRLRNKRDYIEAIVQGAARRIRPKFMTVATMLIGLIPIMLTDGTGSGVMKRIAAPVVGGLATSFLMELIAYPVLYAIWKTPSRHGNSMAEPHIEVRMVQCGTPGPEADWLFAKR